MFRSIAAIAFAIRFGHPDVSHEDATRYAAALQVAAEENDFDPLTGVAIIHRESRFHPRAASKDGEDFGLAQIRARYIGACKKDKDPKRRPSAACQELKQRLLEPEENIRVMGQLITGHRKICKMKTGHASFLGWLASYQGSNSAKHDRWCEPSPGARRVARYRERLMWEIKRNASQIEATDKALAEEAQDRAKLAASREEEAPPEPAKAQGRRGG